jgi:CheY-like chemotaxis protein
MKKILVVDDKQSVTTLYRRLIEADGRYEVFTENLGSRAVETARQCRPDLILLDILMPDILGSEVAAEIRADPALADTKVVFVTAMLKPSDEKIASATGGSYRILAKPISRKDLFLVINQALACPAGSPEETDTTFDIH